MTWRSGAMLALLPFILSGGSGAAQEKAEKQVIVKTTSSSGGWLGVQIQDMTADRAKEMKSKVEEGALIVQVIDGSPAEKAGLKEDDIVIQFGGRTIYDADDLTKTVQKNSPGTKMDVVIQRKGEKKTLAVTLGKRKAESGVDIFTGTGVPHYFSWRSSESTHGLSLRELNPQLGEYFGAPGGKGVLVEEVEKESDAEKAGFKAGDVIIKVGNEIIEDLDDMWDGLEDFSEGQKADVEVLRKGSRQNLSLEVKEDDLRGGHRHRFMVPHGGFQFRVDPPDKEKLEYNLQKLRENLESMKTRIHDEVGRARAAFRRAMRSVSV